MVASLALLLAAMAPPAGEPAGEDTIAIHVFASPAGEPGADAPEALEKDVKQQHGKKREQWPADKRAAVETAEWASVQASLKVHYLDSDPTGKRDSVQDIRNSLAGKGLAGVKKGVRDVAGPEESDLAVEVLGRRRVKGRPEPGILMPLDDFYVWIRISAGGRTDPARLGKVPLAWPGTARLVHTWTDEAPYWELEVLRQGRWANVGNEVSRILDDFTEKSFDALVSSRRTAP